MLKEGDRVEIRCLADGNPTPPFSIHKQVRGLSAGCRLGAGRDAGGVVEWCSTHCFLLSQNPSTREMEEEISTDNGLLVLEPAQKQHSGLYECQGLDLETLIPLFSEPQELLVNCEGLGAPGQGD